MNRKPLNPKLPGPYGRMTARQLDAAVADLDRPISARETRAMTAAERRQWRHAKRRPGRPRRGRGVRVISLSVEQSLLNQADRLARRHGISRAALFETGLRTVLQASRSRP